MKSARSLVAWFTLRAARTLLVLLLVTCGTLALVRYAPGYFSDVREMDAQFSSGVEAELSARRHQDASVLLMLQRFVTELSRGDLGTSVHYRTSVSELLWPTLPVTASLVLRAALLAWAAAFPIALAASLGRSAILASGAALFAALLAAIPVGALATVLVITNWGGGAGPVLALGGILAARDTTFLLRVFRSAQGAPHVLYARAQGLGLARTTMSSVVQPLLPDCASLMSLSLLTALSLVVPVEVLFSVPGLGQLAWTAAMNRDTPVLLAATLVMASAVGATRLVTFSGRNQAHAE